MELARSKPLAGVIETGFSATQAKGLKQASPGLPGGNGKAPTGRDRFLNLVRVVPPRWGSIRIFPNLATVSNFHRYPPGRGNLWKTTPATADALVKKAGRSSATRSRAAARATPRGRACPCRASRSLRRKWNSPSARTSKTTDPSPRSLLRRARGSRGCELESVFRKSFFWSHAMAQRRKGPQAFRAFLCAFAPLREASLNSGTPSEAEALRGAWACSRMGSPSAADWRIAKYPADCAK